MSANPHEMFTGPNRYALKVCGESMIDIGVMDGDYVVIERQNTARNGDIVVAVIESEGSTLKRIFFLPDDQVELHSENSLEHRKRYHVSQVHIQGIMVGLFRSY